MTCLERGDSRQRQKLNGIFVASLLSGLEKVERSIRYKIVYKFYLRDEVKGGIFLGALPSLPSDPTLPILIDTQSLI